jgi:hypothetical protein
MFFRIVDHYNDDEFKNNSNIFENKKNEDICFICYEIKSENENKPLKLNSQEYYIKRCNCDGWIHKKCLDKWYDKSKQCPICRIYMCLKNNNINNNKNGFVIYFIILKKNTARKLHLASMIFLLYFTCEFYISIINKKNYYYDNFKEEYY